MRMVRALALFAVVLVPSSVWAAPILATYTFTGSPGNQASESVDVQPFGATFSDITRGSGVTAFLGASSINSVNWETSASIVAEDDVTFAQV
jgi:hypothetical protein